MSRTVSIPARTVNRLCFRLRFLFSEVETEWLETASGAAATVFASKHTFFITILDGVMKVTMLGSDVVTTWTATGLAEVDSRTLCAHLRTILDPA